MASSDAPARRRILIIGDSLSAPRLTVKYRDTWVCRIKNAMPEDDFIVLVDGGRTSKFLAINPIACSDGKIKYDPYPLEIFEPSIVILNIGLVDCAPRLFGRMEGYFVERMPKGLRDGLIFLAKRFRTRTDRRAYVGPEEFESNVRQFLERSRNIKIDRFIIIGIATPDARALVKNPGLAAAAEKYNEIYKRLSEQFNFVTFFSPCHPKESISELYLEDGYHLSCSGHSVVGNAIAAILKDQQVIT